QVRQAADALEVKAASKGGTSVDDLYAHVVDTFNAVYVKIWRAVAEKGKREQLVRGLDSFLASANEFAPLFVGITLAEDGRLPRDVVIANLMFAPTNNKVEYLHRGLSDLLYFELFTAGEAVDRK